MTPESVIEQQAQVDAVIEDTYRLARQLGDHFKGTEPLRETFALEYPPFCYAAFGEAGSGKTTLLAHLAGCAWETPADETRVGCALWCHTPSSARWKKTQPGGIIERYADVEFLKTCTIMDSGASSDPAVVEQAASASAQSDVIFLLFREQNPLCPDTWKLADRFMTNGYRNVVIVLTQYEGTSMDAAATLEHLREVAALRWQYRVPVVAFSTRESELERSSIVLKKAAASLSAVSFNRRELLKGKLAVAYGLIQELREVVSAQDLAMRQDGGFLQTLEWEIDQMREDESRRVAGRCEAMRGIAEEFLPQVMKAAAGKLGYYPSFTHLFAYRSLPIKIDEWFFMYLGKAMEARLESYDLEFMERCRAHWDDVRPRAMSQLNCDIGEFPRADLERELSRRRLHVRRALYKPLVDFKLRGFLADEFAHRETWLRSLIALALCMLAIGCLLGLVGFYGPAMACWALALLLWLGGAFALGVSRRNLLECAEDLQERFGRIVEQGLRRPLDEAALCSVAGYRNGLAAIHSQISLSRDALVPVQERLSEVYKNCYALNNNIR